MGGRFRLDPGGRRLNKMDKCAALSGAGHHRSEETIIEPSGSRVLGSEAAVISKSKGYRFYQRHPCSMSSQEVRMSGHVW